MVFAPRKLLLNKRDTQAIREFRGNAYKLLGNGLKMIMLFGSKAEGKDTPESDIDLVVLIEDSAVNMNDQIFDLAFEVNLKYEVYISPRIITLSTYNHPVWAITPFIKGLKAKGIAI